MGFEPTHGDRIGLAVQRLNHSATLSMGIGRYWFLLSTSSNDETSDVFLFTESCCKCWFLHFSYARRVFSSKNTTEMGFEPTHGDRIGLAVQRLNHSATLSVRIGRY